MVQLPIRQIAGVYHRRIGDIVVTALSDGYLDGTVDVLQNITANDSMHILDENFRPGRRTSVNRYAIFSAGRLALIETDTDPHAAAATRKQVLDMVATDRQLVAGMHMHYPGFAHVVRQGDSYLMLPEPWDQAF